MGSMRWGSTVIDTWKKADYPCLDQKQKKILDLLTEQSRSISQPRESHRRKKPRKKEPSKKSHGKEISCQ